jgi:exosortase/archaeosortase family protein
VLVSQVRTSTSWLVTWAVLAVGPLVPYALPLVRWALADTPLAYLVWVAPIAMLWAVDNIRRLPAYPDDGELNSLMGGALLFTVGLALIGGPHLWPFVFTQDRLALLLWPLWALALAWLWFGVAVTPALIAPLSFLLLGWPPLMQVVAAHTQGALLALDRAVLSAATRLPGTVAWLRLASDASVVRIAYGHGWLPVAVASACSGADSVLAAIIVLPFVLSRSVGSGVLKVALVGATAGAALVLNLLRVAVLLIALHLWGSAFTFGTLHPVLGPLLFLVLAVTLVRVADRLHLLPLEGPAGDDVVSLPSPGRTVAGLLSAIALTLGLLPVMTAPPGVLGRTVAVRSLTPLSLFPHLAGFTPVVLGTYDDSSVLGPGSASAAVAYSNPAGAYVLAQVWLTPTLGALGSYGYDNCLMFHGDTIVATRSFALADGALATAYGVELPPAQVGGRGPLYLDVEWTHSVTADGRTAYIRVALAAPPEAAAAWAGQGHQVPKAPPLWDGPWIVPDHGRFPIDLGPMLDRIVAFANRFDRGLEGSRRS